VTRIDQSKRRPSYITNIYIYIVSKVNNISYISRNCYFTAGQTSPILLLLVVSCLGTVEASLSKNIISTRHRTVTCITQAFAVVVCHTCSHILYVRIFMSGRARMKIFMRIIKVNLNENTYQF
jgi:hypothetical protein